MPGIETFVSYFIMGNTNLTVSVTIVKTLRDSFTTWEKAGRRKAATLLQSVRESASRVQGRKLITVPCLGVFRNASTGLAVTVTSLESES